MVTYMSLPGLKSKPKVPLFKACTMDVIEEVVCEFYGLPISKMYQRNRTADVVLCRHMIMFLTKLYTPLSLKRIGLRFGAKDHTVVIHAIRSIRNRLDTEEAIRKHRMIIEDRIFGT